ncbi:Serine/threonine-protein kinase PTK2/STK2 [Nakaseomyces glabratus]|nr:Serine/threonine-protein kinase PTK2/STK2 [Nakaseomyces glabratus]KTB24778.1 Serine/threonine-protein kinase PTK2/STK2 [Nakaseomyces glabratus]
MTNINDKEEVHHSPSVMALKKFGRKLMNHPQVSSGKPVLDAQGEPIRPLSKRSTSPTGKTLVRNSSRSPSRARSSSLSKKVPARATEANFTRGPVSSAKSSVALNELIKHSHNPYVITEEHSQRAPNQLQRKPSAGAAALSSAGGGSGIAGRREAHTHHGNKPASMAGHANQGHSLSRNPSKSGLHADANMVYNPYGMNPNLRRPDTAYIDTLKENAGDLSFYMHDGNEKIRMLPLPIEDPNKFLPEEMQQFSINLADNFVFDAANKPIGSGGSSEVRKVKSAYKAKDVYALKKLNMIYHETPEKFYKRCSKEFIIAKSLSKNIHIIKTFYLLKVPTTTYTTRGWGFIMEYGVKDLFELMARSGWRNVPLEEKYCLFKQVAEGIKFCHDNGIAHRDLKPENVLLSKDGVCKLTDFGISDWYRKDPNDPNSPLKTTEGMIGSPPYTPPEVMYWDAKKHYAESLKKPYDPLKMDPYALGIMLITMVNNIIPFLDSCNTDLRFREYETSYENFIAHGNPAFRQKGVYKPGPGSEYSLAKQFRNTEASRVAWRLADPKPETRYTMEDLFNDPWFQNIKTCVYPDDAYTVTEPELRKATTQEGLVYANQLYAKDTIETAAGTVGATFEDASDTIPVHTGNHGASTGTEKTHEEGCNASSPKPRSMVEIAEHPVLHKEKPTEHHGKVTFSMDDDNDNDNDNDKDNEEEAKENKLDAMIESPAPTKAQQSPKAQDATRTTSTLRTPEIHVEPQVQRGSPVSSMASRSTTASPPHKEMSELSVSKKRVVHNHFDIPHSSVNTHPSMVSLFSK